MQVVGANTNFVRIMKKGANSTISTIPKTLLAPASAKCSNEVNPSLFKPVPSPPCIDSREWSLPTPVEPSRETFLSPDRATQAPNVFNLSRLFSRKSRPSEEVMKPSVMISPTLPSPSLGLSSPELPGHIQKQYLRIKVRYANSSLAIKVPFFRDNSGRATFSHRVSVDKVKSKILSKLKIQEEPANISLYLGNDRNDNVRLLDDEGLYRAFSTALESSWKYCLEPQIAIFAFLMQGDRI